MLKELIICGLTLFSPLTNLNSVDKNHYENNEILRQPKKKAIEHLEIGVKYQYKTFNNNTGVTDVLIFNNLNFSYSGLKFGSIRLASNTSSNSFFISQSSTFSTNSRYSINSLNNFWENYNPDAIWIFNDLTNVSNTALETYLINIFTIYDEPTANNLYDLTFDFIHDNLLNTSYLDNMEFTIGSQNMSMRTWLSHALSITALILIFSFIIMFIIWLFKWFGGLFKWW